MGMFELLNIRDWVDFVFSPVVWGCFGAVIGFEALVWGFSWALNVLCR